MSKNKAFTVSFFGRSRLLGLVVVDGLKAFPKSTWYDYSNQMKAAVAGESRIASSGYMTPAGVKSVRLAVGNQKSPRHTDVVLRFSCSASVETVQITVGKKSRTMVIHLKSGVLDNPYRSSNQVLQAIEKMVQDSRVLEYV